MPSGDRPPITRAVRLRAAGFAVATVLGAVAVWLIVTSHTQKGLQIGVLAGLWGLLLGAYSMFGSRRAGAQQANTSAGRASDVGSDVATRPSAQLQRAEEAAERREYEKRLEQMLRREITTAMSRQVSSLRAEIAQLRHDLLEKVGGQLRLERIETTRLIGSDLEALQHEVRQLKVANETGTLSLSGPHGEQTRVTEVRQVIESTPAGAARRSDRRDSAARDPRDVVDAEVVDAELVGEDARPAAASAPESFAPESFAPDSSVPMSSAPDSSVPASSTPAARVWLAQTPETPERTPPPVNGAGVRKTAAAAAAVPPATSDRPVRERADSPAQSTSPIRPPADRRRTASAERTQSPDRDSGPAAGRSPARSTQPPAKSPRRAERPVASAPAMSPPAKSAPPVAPDPVTPEPVAPEPVVSEPVVSEPVASEPVVSEPIASEPIVSEPIVSESVASESVVAAPSVEAEKPAAVAPEPSHPMMSDDPFASLPRIRPFTDFELDPIETPTNGSSNGAAEHDPAYTGRRRRTNDADPEASRRDSGRHSRPEAEQGGGRRRRAAADDDETSDDLLQQVLSRQSRH